MQPLSGAEYGGMLSDLIRVPYAEAMLQPIARHLDPVALASVSDNVPDGYRAVAPHLAAHRGARSSSSRTACRAFPSTRCRRRSRSARGRVDFASDDAESLALAERLGAHPIETDFEAAAGLPDRRRRRPHPQGLRYAIRRPSPRASARASASTPAADIAGAARPDVHARHPFLRRPLPRRGDAARGGGADRVGAAAPAEVTTRVVVGGRCARVARARASSSSCIASERPTAQRGHAARRRPGTENGRAGCRTDRAFFDQHVARAAGGLVPAAEPAPSLAAHRGPR